MKTLFLPFRHLLVAAALPTALSFSACKKDKDNPPAPDQGKVMLVHAAASANVRVKALVNDTEVNQLDFGANSGYLNVNTGSPTLKINVASSNQTAASKVVTVEKDKNYSVFAFAPTATTVDLLPLPDDLAAPAAGQAKIRVVHLAFNGPNPVKLSQSTVAGFVDIPSISSVFANAATFGFVNITPGNYNLAVTTGSPSTAVVSVGDGSGSGTGTKNYEAGKIYTVVVRGIVGSLIPEQQPKATLIQNN